MKQVHIGVSARHIHLSQAILKFFLDKATVCMSLRSFPNRDNLPLRK